MGREGAAVAPRVRLVVATVVGAAIAWLLPWVAAATADAPSLLLATSLAVAALVGLHDRAVVRATAVPAPPRPSTETVGVVLLAGRVTDAPHHPLRPRAPGLV